MRKVSYDFKSVSSLRARGLDLTIHTSKLKKWQRIWVNRSLNMATIKAVGFDMDHTLAMYNRAEFEALAFRETLKKFIDAGYPSALKKLEFNPDFIIRGLLVDIDRGNLLKVDAHKYVKIAFHGHTRLDKDTRHRLYNSESFKAYEFLSVDTFFALSEVQLFTEIVDYMRRNPGKVRKTFREVYADLRKFIDLSHADGSIKNHVMRYPEKFINRDKFLPTTLKRLIDSGKNLFLLTNSSIEYTNVIMGHLLDGADPELPHWRDYFTWSIVSAGKPGFFMGKDKFSAVTFEGRKLGAHQGPLTSELAYTGGNAKLFQDLTGIRGDEILYVGDHIYGDIIRSKGAVNWRTILVVEELDEELPKLESLKGDLDAIADGLVKLEAMDEQIQILRSKIASNARQAKLAWNNKESRKSRYLTAENEKLIAKFQDLEVQQHTLEDHVKELTQAREAKVHPVWGELMKVGLERSRFANQVEDYACMYTSRVSNIRFYSPWKRFKAFFETLPHEA
jgi:5'-nucleotidase